MVTGRLRNGTTGYWEVFSEAGIWFVTPAFPLYMYNTVMVSGT